jgi:hypothetical protein
MALYEEQSKKARIFQREKRQELQLIIERCNKIAFKYVCIPKERTDNVVFGAARERKIYLNAEDKSVNSYMRRCFKEHFAESKIVNFKCGGQQGKDEQLLTMPFASKVPRFQENIVIDASKIFRRKKKHNEIQQEKKVCKAAFGMSSKRNLMITREIRESITAPGTYNLSIAKKSFKHHSFGGKIKIENAYDIICGPNNENWKCDQCENVITNVFWKNQKTNVVLCSKCYNNIILDIKNTSRGALDRARKMQSMENYKKKRYCGFYHEHNNTTAALRILPTNEFHRRIKKENFLNTILKY